MLRIFFILSLFLLLPACGTTPIKENSDKIEVTSADFGFIDSLLENGENSVPIRKIDVYLTTPDPSQFKPPYAAVVLLHSSWGLSRQEWFYANVFRRMGIATFSIDSFTPRGVEKTSMDQTRVSSASMLQDAYAVLNISAEASDDEVKKAYRRLLSQHHPDKLVAKGLPEEMIKLATERTHQIRSAYEQIRGHRGF